MAYQANKQLQKNKTKGISANKIAGAFSRFRYKQGKIIDTIIPIDFDKPISSIKVGLKLKPAYPNLPDPPDNEKVTFNNK